jgi:peptidoglycan/xylan/chitin deacetylase (PgdA/CDA1 family)
MPANSLAIRPGENKAQYRKRVELEMRAHAARYRGAIRRGEIPVVMDVDDFGFLMPGYDDLLRLKAAFPGFKITCFTIPLPKEFYHSRNSAHFSMDKYRKWAEIVNRHDWIEVAIHGFSHVHHELEVPYAKAIDTITAAEKLFDRVGLRYAKIYKAPYWQYSYDAIAALRDKGYVVAIDRDHARPVPDGTKTYLHNWSFEEPIPEVPVIKGHGHFTGQNRNNISATLDSICRQIPRDATFMTIGEHLAAEAAKGENGSNGE